MYWSATPLPSQTSAMLKRVVKQVEATYLVPGNRAG